VVPAKTLAALFSEHGIESYINSTHTLFALLSEGGKLLDWNPAFDSIKQAMHDVTYLRDCLSLSSRTVFDLLLSSVTHDRIQTQGELELGQGNRLSGYACFLYPVPEGRVLFVGEPSHAASDLESLSDELKRTRQRLERKAIELRAALSQPRETANTDALTSLPNRLQIMLDLQEAVAFSDQYGTPLCILILDIDHFKTINDAHGHAAGDEVLRALASQLADFVHAPGLIGRHGGEEFLIVLPHTTVKSAVEYAAQLCEEVRGLAIVVRDQMLSITVSLGIAQYRLKKEDWQAFLHRADQALTSAKRQGRDRWVLEDE
jgi:diguanylate cyclase (GGDEF)-like protein